MQILKEDCPKEEGNDRTLPYTAYVVEYKDKDGKVALRHCYI